MSVQFESKVSLNKSQWQSIVAYACFLLQKRVSAQRMLVILHREHESVQRVEARWQSLWTMSQLHDTIAAVSPISEIAEEQDIVDFSNTKRSSLQRRMDGRPLWVFLSLEKAAGRQPVNSLNMDLS